MVGGVVIGMASGSKVSVRLTDEPGAIRLLVEDSGPGFPDGILDAENRPVRFRKGDAQRSGSTGLGLSMIYEVVENHRGTVEIGRSSLGGALIAISFPK